MDDLHRAAGFLGTALVWSCVAAGLIDAVLCELERHWGVR